MSDIIQLIFFAFASVLHGLTGMGFPMVGTAVLSFVLPLPIAIAIVAFPTFIMNTLIVFAKSQRQNLWDELQFIGKKYWILAITSVLGSIIGVKLLFILPVAYLNLLMATITLYYAINGYLSQKGLIKAVTVPTGNLSMAIFGGLSGLVGGATNAMSPILLMYLFAKTDDKHEIAKASNVCYLLAKIVQIYLLKEQILQFDPRQWQLLIAITLISIVFLYIGIYLRNKVSQTLFKNVIYAVLVVLSLKIGYTGITSLLF